MSAEGQLGTIVQALDFIKTNWRHMPRRVRFGLELAGWGALVSFGAFAFRYVMGSSTAPLDPSRTWSSPETAPAVYPTVNLREIHPSGDGQLIVKNLNANGFGGSINIAGGDNGTASVTLENVSLTGGKGPTGGGEVNLRAGRGGPNGTGGALTVKDSNIMGGDTK